MAFIRRSMVTDLNLFTVYLRVMPVLEEEVKILVISALSQY